MLVAPSMFVVILVTSALLVTDVRGCGVSMAGSRVIGGMDAKPGAWPWQVGLYKTSSTSSFFCGGSLITPKWVVTAAHCVARSSNPSHYYIRLGDFNRYVFEGTEETIMAKKIIKHERYNTPSPINNDIALIELSRPATLNSRIGVVCLPSSGETVPSGSRCFITGWGKIKHPGSSHNILQQAVLPPVTNEECKKKLASSPGGSKLKITAQMICAGNGPVLSGCHGDSGGPYVCPNSAGRYVLQGAVSWGSPRCSANERYTVFARVAEFRNWINTKIGVSPPTPPPPTSGAVSCGIRPHSRIVGGTEAHWGDWPWQAQLRTSSGFAYCGGTLVSFYWVVTAAHCVRGKSARSVFVRLGAHKRTGNVGSEQDFSVLQIILHPSYQKPKRYAHDIALLKLNKQAKITRFVNFACLPQTVPGPTDGKKCWITGFGRLSSGGPSPNVLMQASVPIVSRARCEKAYPGKLHDSMICAGLEKGGIDSCQGDSGGPMVCESGGHYYLQGATSWGYGCAAPGKFGVYANVKYLLSWIDTNIGVSIPSTPSTKLSSTVSVPPTPSMKPSSEVCCNFDKDSCGFVQLKDDNFDWSRRKGTTPSQGTGPSGDHGGYGYYMYIETSNPRVAGDRAKMERTGIKFSGNTCIHFFYHMFGAGMGTLNVYVGRTKVFTKSRSQGNKWIKSQVRISHRGIDSLMFEGIRGSSYSSDIAIDDVIVKECKAGVSIPSTPSTKPSISTVLVPSTQSMKPSSQVFCDFKDSCGFVQLKDDNFDWSRRKGTTPSQGTGPSGDHGGYGYYMYIEASSPRVTGDRAKMERTGIKFSGNTCIHFFYHMFGVGLGTLNVYVGRTKVFTKSGNQGNKWIKAQVRVSQKGFDSLMFEGIRGSSYSSDIAIDDVTLKECKAGGVHCDFNKDACTFVQLIGDNFDWSRRKGSTPSVGTGPNSDYSGSGYYMYVETSRPRVSGDKAMMERTGIKFSGNTCIHFFYHMFGAGMGTLNVYVGCKKVFTKSGNQGNKWLQAEVKISQKGVLPLMFEGICGSSYQGDIAVDEVSVQECKKEYRCDFDVNMCGFVQSSSDKFDWTRHSGPTKSIQTGPSADHTTGNKGHYMFIETSSPRKQGDNAKLELRNLKIYGKKCLQFYYNMNGSDIGTLNVFAGSSKAWTKSGPQGTTWKKAIVQLTGNGVTTLVFEGIRGGSWRGDIAIDDISITESCLGA